MSPQLKLSAIASTVAMALFALAGHGPIAAPGLAIVPQAGFSAAITALPPLGTLLPRQQ